MTPVSLRHSRHPRLTALLAGAVVPLALVLGLTLPTSIDRTEAGWTSVTAVSADEPAVVFPGPTLTRACQFRSILGLGAHVRVFWALPAGYTLSDVRVDASTSGLGSILAPLTGFSVSANTQRQADGTYHTDIPTNLLGGLLGLGSELELAIRVEDSTSGWASQPASVASNAGLIGGLGGNCRNLS